MSNHVVGRLEHPYERGISSSQLTNSYFSEEWLNHQQKYHIPFPGVNMFQAAEPPFILRNRRVIIDHARYSSKCTSINHHPMGVS